MDRLKDPVRMVMRGLGTWIGLCVVAGAILRIVLLCHPLTVATGLTFGQWIGMFGLGIVNDVCIAMLAALPLMCFWLCSGHWRFKSPQCYAFIALLILGWAYLTYGCKPLWEFNKHLARIISWVMVGWIVTFMLRTFLPKIRALWMQIFTGVLLFVYVSVLVMNVVGEWFFWNEFGVRYNFIAVDYLVYTSEVVGNIMQSYSMDWIITGVIIVSATLEWLLFRRVILASAWFHQKGWRPKVGGAAMVGSLVSLAVLPLSEKAQHSENVYYNGLQANGVYCFYKAFTSNKLDYKDFYIICPDDMMPPALLSQSVADSIPSDTSIIKPNIVLITMESMSADYMRRFGNDKNLTPELDSLWSNSIAFERMFAAGNRTVRGLEALILSRPPSPGESIIKREDNTGYPSVVDKLKDMGYAMSFYYGGNSYFDNMESFFAGLGYDICDNKTMKKEDITCQTVWGVCDGDVYGRVLADMDCKAALGQPIFAHILTTSNHRPYIYPEGCVSIPPTKHSREGAVMYSDYALGRFIAEASTRPWMANTVFVISADHCASSAGSTELPLENYHIPALIYAPALFDPQRIDVTASQIDVFPTLFGLLGWGIDANLYGRDVLSPDYLPRAFVATYQDLGYFSNDTLTVLSPGRKFRQYVMSPTDENPYATAPVDSPSWSHIYTSAALYQSSERRQ